MGTVQCVHKFLFELFGFPLYPTSKSHSVGSGKFQRAAAWRTITQESQEALLRENAQQVVIAAVLRLRHLTLSVQQTILICTSQQPFDGVVFLKLKQWTRCVGPGQVFGIDTNDEDVGHAKLLEHLVHLRQRSIWNHTHDHGIDEGVQVVQGDLDASARHTPSPKRLTYAKQLTGIVRGVWFEALNVVQLELSSLRICCGVRVLSVVPQRSLFDKVALPRTYSHASVCLVWINLSPWECTHHVHANQASICLFKIRVVTELAYLKAKHRDNFKPKLESGVRCERAHSCCLRPFSDRARLAR
eukprot:1116071-Amphidinium_carterae.2